MGLSEQHLSSNNQMTMRMQTQHCQRHNVNVTYSVKTLLLQTIGLTVEEQHRLFKLSAVQFIWRFPADNQQN